MAAAKLLIDRVIPSRRGAPVSFHIRPLKIPEDCALAYADLLDDSLIRCGSAREALLLNSSEILANALGERLAEIYTRAFSSWLAQ